MPANYLTTTAPYNTKMKFIYTKWLALYHTGIESWLDWKRTENQVLFSRSGTNNGKSRDGS
jgi:hypothetical protein